MPRRAHSLREILRAEWRAAGVLSLARFMELALYHPEHGYYVQPERSIGRAGDFYTSVSVGPVFGELLAWQWRDWTKGIGEDRWTWLEAGAHDGRLARDILTFVRQSQPEFFARLEYWILEPSSRRQTWQKETLREFASQVRWFADWPDLPSRGIRGVIFANELLDAFPARRLCWDAPAHRWFEWGVAFEGDRLVWVKMESPGQGHGAEAAGHAPLPGWLTELPGELLTVLPNGFTVDVSPAADAWWRQAATTLQRGKLMTIDYGLQAEQFLQPERARGTLRAYYHHHIAPDPLSLIGQQDLTTSIDFTSLERAGEAAGLSTEPLATQEQFLTGILRRITAPGGTEHDWDSSRRRQFQTLIHPDHLGRAFQVFVQSRA